MIKVAIDGPAGAGKSSIAQNAAKQLGFIYIDTGAMYRAAAVYALENGIEINEKNITAEVLDNINVDIRNENGVQLIFLNGKDVTKRIRMADASRASSDISTIPAVREKLVLMQRQLAEKSNVIMDGRDIGTCVLPDAELKIFLTASVEERANRRYRELCEKGVEADLTEIKKEIIYRDEQDSNRKVSPLKRAEDALLLDTSDMNFDEVLSGVIKLIEEAL